MVIDNDQGVEYEVVKDDAVWRDELSPGQYAVLRDKGTERPGTGEYNKFYPEAGHFACAACGIARSTLRPPNSTAAVAGRHSTRLSRALWSRRPTHR